MDLNEIIPDELWLIVMNYVSFKDLLIFRKVCWQWHRCIVTWLETIDKGLKLSPHQFIYLPFYKVIGTSLHSVNLLWSAKDITFNKPVSDQQPRNANRGFGFTDTKWVWIRGPLTKRIGNSPHPHTTETHICIYQENNIPTLCNHLRKYEVEFLSDYIDHMSITCNAKKSKEGTVMVSWVGPSPRTEKQKGCLVC